MILTDLAFFVQIVQSQYFDSVDDADLQKNTTSEIENQSDDATFPDLAHPRTKNRRKTRQLVVW